MKKLLLKSGQAVKKCLANLTSLALVPILAIRKPFVNLRRAKKIDEARYAIATLRNPVGCSAEYAKRKYDLILHVIEHYGTTFAELGFAGDEHDLCRLFERSIEIVERSSLNVRNGSVKGSVVEWD